MAMRAAMRQSSVEGPAMFGLWLSVALVLVGLAETAPIGAVPSAQPGTPAQPATPAPRPPEEPIEIETTFDGDVLIGMSTADYSRNGIVRYDADLVYQHRWPMVPSPVAIAAHPDGGIFVLRGRSIVRFSRDGIEGTSWVAMPDGPWGINDLDFGPSGLLHLVDHAYLMCNDNIRQATVDGETVRRWRTGGCAYSLAVGPEGRVFVPVETNPHRKASIVRFTADGQREIDWDLAGLPADIAVAPDGTVAVVYQPDEAQLGRIEFFTRDGANVRGWNVPPSIDPQSMARVKHVAVGPTGESYVLARVYPSVPPGTDGRPLLYHFDASGNQIGVLRGFVTVGGPSVFLPMVAHGP